MTLETTSFLTATELDGLGLASLGKGSKISRRASIYGAARLHIGENVRIDDFVVISAGEGGIRIGSHVHIAVFGLLMGAAHIELRDFANLSSRVTLYSSSDDFSGHHMTSPVIPARFTGVTNAPVTIGRHALLGTGCTLLPGVTIGDGTAVGAMTLVKNSLEPYGIFAGSPIRRIGDRSRKLLELEAEFIRERATTAPGA